VEPRLLTQWFLAVNKQPKSGGLSLAGKAIQVVEKDEIVFTPQNYENIYLDWMQNIYDWCISRQLWWGHRIPAWHCADCKEITVAREAPGECRKCGSKNLEQDTDVLDTWFSSALLPFTAFGWPSQDEKTQRDLATFYPTSLLITGFDILFFWVARMIMMGSFFMRDHKQDPAVKSISLDKKRTHDSVPFRDVYVHALVRDAERQKMSKTKGNVIDPIEITQKYGTDAVRFTLASMASPGTDIAFNEARTEGYRAFANKIWNAARFIFMNADRAEAAGVWRLSDFQKKSQAPSVTLQRSTLERVWILSRLNRVTQNLNSALESYRFHDAANEIYQFFWGDFCDWYIEIVKLRLNAVGDSSEAGKAETRAAFDSLLLVFERSLRLLSPFMPFLTEELWHALYDGKAPEKSIALASYPKAGPPSPTGDAAETEMAILQDLIVNIRNIRAELEVPPKDRVPVRIFAVPEVRESFTQNRTIIEKLANVNSIDFVRDSLAKAPSARSTARFDVAVVYEKKVDIAAECDRLKKELARLEAERSNAGRQLSNDGFLRKAPANVVDGVRSRKAELDALIEKLRRALDELH